MRRLSMIGFVVYVCCSSLSQAEENKTSLDKWGPSIEKFEQSDQASPPMKGQVLFIGSSSIRMWDLKESFPDLDALNRGFGGSEIEDSIVFFDRIVKPYQPRQIVMYAGDNDLAHNKTPKRVTQDFLTFAKLVKEHLPETTLVFVAVKPSIKRWNLIESVRQANQLVQAECEKDEQLTFLDIETPMIGEDGKPKPELFVKDGLHMSKAGYKVWSDLLRPHLTKSPTSSH